jgi:hypothetical protein
MKSQTQTILLAVIAVALVAIAVGQFIDFDSDKPKTVVAQRAANVEAPPITPAPVKDPANLSALNPVEPVDNTPKTSMAFKSMKHDFGKVKKESTNTHVFSFTNTGKEPLIIKSATGSCGCTVPEYPKEPIAPGKSSTIKVEYKPGQQSGFQSKTVRVVANTEPSEETVLTISAEVVD